MMNMPQIQMMMGMLHLPWCIYACSNIFGEDKPRGLSLFTKEWRVPFCPEYFYRELVPRVRDAYFSWFFPALLCKLNEGVLSLSRPWWIAQALEGVEEKKRKKQSGYVGVSFADAKAPANQACKERLMRILRGEVEEEEGTSMEAM